MLENEAKGDSIKLQPLQTGVDIVGDTTATKEKNVRKCHTGPQNLVDVDAKELVRI